MLKTSIQVLIKLFIFVQVFVYGFVGFSQSHVYKNYGVEDGLPSSEVYSAFQDSKGYMWFATDAGVSRFNGYEFQTFDVSDGLTDNTVFLITEDKKGRIWFGTFNYQLSFYDEGVIYPYKFNPVLSDSISDKTSMRSFYVDSKETIWIGLKDAGIFKINAEGEASFLKNSRGSELKMNLKMTYVEGREVLGLYKGKLFRKEISLGNRKPIKWEWEYDLGNGAPTEKGSIVYGNSSNNVYSFGLVRHKDKVILFMDNFMMELDSKKPNDRKYVGWLKNKIIHSISSIDNYLWICVRNEGVYKCGYENGQLIRLEHFLPESSVSKIFKDDEGGFWFLTLTQGIYYLSDYKVGNKENEGKILLQLEIDSLSGNLYKYYDNGSIAVNDLGNNNDKILVAPGKIYYEGGMKFDYFENSIFIENYKYSIGKKSLVKQEVSAYNIVSKSFLMDSGRVFRVGNYGLSITEKNQEVYSSFAKDEMRMWCTSVEKVDDEIWIGTKDGLRKFVNEEIIEPFSENKYLSTAITSLVKLDDLVLIGTKSYGLLVVKNDSIINIIDEDDGLVSNLIRTIHVDNQKVVWLGTSKGICELTFTSENDFDIHNITKKHGLISAEIRDVESYKNLIYAVTQAGLVSFDKKKILKNNTPSKLYITSFKANDSLVDLESHSSFNYRENNIKIEYVGINYRSLGNVEYQYRMTGVDSNWVSTHSTSVQYRTLPAGDYSFELKSKNENGVWNPSPIILSFSIQPPFWLSWWFFALLILVLIGVVTIFFKIREKKLIAKNEVDRKNTITEKRMVELELKALRSQMNPHFIFNILNSIQHYIIKNDFRSTNRYITQFAKLIRTVLNLSEKAVITIQEELDMLTLYMSLEKMRFSEQFSYEIVVGEEIDVDYDEIPSMLIQPYVENSIWHGLMNKEKKGNIKINLSLSDGYLCCAIEDNGIGREEAEKIRSRRKIAQKSVGMSITKERLDLINENNVNVKTIDLKDKSGIALGTRIEIKIPYKN